MASFCVFEAHDFHHLLVLFFFYLHALCCCVCFFLPLCVICSFQLIFDSGSWQHTAVPDGPCKTGTLWPERIFDQIQVVLRGGGTAQEFLDAKRIKTDSSLRRTTKITKSYKRVDT